MKKRKLRAFLNYTSRDWELVYDLYRRLKQDGIDPWIDQENLLPGHDWKLEIAKSIRNSDVILVCLSNKALNKRGYVQKEIRLALDISDEQPEGAIFLIPIRLEPCDVPMRLEDYHWVNLYEDDGYSRLLNALQARAREASLAEVAIREQEILGEKDVLPPPMVHEEAKRVGVFVVLEYLWPLVPQGMNPQEVGERLTAYASQFGNVVCRWACADPRNLTDSINTKLALERSGFSVSFPPGELLRNKKNSSVADLLLLERITDARLHQQPEVFIIVSGDRDYYERILNLMEQNYTVRLAAPPSAVANIYFDLEEQRRQIRFTEGYTDTDFHLDDLDQILTAGSSE